MRVCVRVYYECVYVCVSVCYKRVYVCVMIVRVCYERVCVLEREGMCVCMRERDTEESEREIALLS